MANATHHISISRQGQYVTVQNAGFKGASVAVANFLGHFAKKGAFLRMSAGPMAEVHAIQIGRVEAFIAYCQTQGFTVGWEVA